MSEETFCDCDIPHGRINWCIHGSDTSYTCDEGYERTTDWLSCLYTSGKWEPNPPIPAEAGGKLCVPKSCPDQIPNGALTQPCLAKVGETCQYTCDSGYSKVFTSSNIVCETSTNWSRNPHALCLHNTLQQCSYFVENGDLDLSCKRLPGDTCTFSCRVGYTFQTPNTIYCDSSHRWSRSLQSVCERSVCPLTIPNGRISRSCFRDYGSICINYKCNPGYVKPLVRTRLTCNASLEWTWPESAGQPCFREEGLCPSRIKNGQILCDNHRQPGAVCTYTCDPGCTKDWSVDWLHCGEGGKWWEYTGILCTSCSPVTTTAESLCPAKIPNGQIDSPCSRTPLSRCFITCDTGCRAEYSTLYCSSELYWNFGDTACDCSDFSNSNAIPESYNSSSGYNAAAMIGGIVGAIVAVVLVIVVCVIITRKRPRGNTMNTGIAAQRIDAGFEGYSSRTTRAADSRGSSPEPDWITSPNHETHSRYSSTTDDGTSLPRLTNLPQLETDSTSQSQRYNDNSNFTDRSRAYRRTPSAPEEPPPSYDEVISDPNAFKL